MNNNEKIKKAMDLLHEAEADGIALTYTSEAVGFYLNGDPGKIMLTVSDILTTAFEKRPEVLKTILSILFSIVVRVSNIKDYDRTDILLVVPSTDDE